MYLFIYQDSREKLDTQFAVFSNDLTTFTGWYSTPADCEALIVDVNCSEPQSNPASLIKQWGPFNKFQSITYYEVPSIESLPTLFPELFI